MTAFADAAVALLGTLKQAAGVPVTYHRGTNSAGITAIPGQSLIESTDDKGRLVQFTSADWLVQASELVVAGAVITPQREDRISRTVGTLRTYEILEPPFKPMDAEAKTLRIYTKRIA